jgi:uncharacterized protein (DUF58 family)
MQPTVIEGAYVSVDQLLALRFRPTANKSTRATTMTGTQAGLRLSKHKGRGVDFAEVRQYQPGDDIRSIDWRVTARKNAPHTKVFREERERPALIFVDQGQHMFFGSTQRLKSVAAAELAARIAWQITGTGDRVGGMVLDNSGHHVFRPFRTVKATGRLLTQISQSNTQLCRPTSTTSDKGTQNQQLEHALVALAKLRQRRNRLFVISDLAGPLMLWRDALHRLARDHQVHVLQITDPLDAQLPPAGVYNISHGDENVSFFSGDRALRERHAQAHATRTAEIQGICQHPALSLQVLSTADTSWDHLSWA